MIFGLYFATLDIRQDSGVHTTVLAAIGDKNGVGQADPGLFEEPFG